MRQIVSGLLLLGALIGQAPDAWCDSADQGWKAIGVRGGVSATSRNEYFHQYVAYGTYGLPWSLRSDSGFGVALQLDAAAGMLHAGEKNGVIGSVGPAVILDKRGKGLAFRLGADVCGVNKYNFGSVDLNGNLLFDGHVGLLYRFASGPGLGYRFHHISNGGLAVGGHGGGNTGVDFHMIDLSWNFY